MLAATDRSWLHHNISGTLAEQLLNTEGKVGSFLVRPSLSDVGQYSLSVRLPDSVTHLRVNFDGDCYELPHTSAHEKFASLSDLVQYYTEGGPGFGTFMEKNGSGIEMRFPLPTSDYCTERFFHRHLSGQEAEQCLMSFKAGLFLVRPSQTQAGNFVLSVRTSSDRMQIFHAVITFGDDGQCTLGDGYKFRSLAQLVNFYRTHQITDKSGIKVILKQAVDMTQFRVSNIGVQVALLEKVFEVNGVMRDGFWEEFEHLQSQEDTYNQRFDSGLKAENRKKNRYKNILPYEHSRVVLQNVDSDVPGSDYINANYITVGDNHKKRYIATQGCLQNTVADFWHMIWQEKSAVIAMLTQCLEAGKMKCVQYWPNSADDPLILPIHKGKLVVEAVSSRQDTSDWIQRVFRLSKVSSKGKSESARTIYQYHYLEWPDKKVPTATDAATVLEYIQQINGRWLAQHVDGPLVVHCSAGIGRTGTYIAVDVLIKQIQEEGEACEIDVPRTIQTLRQSRAGLVQVWHQYRFIYIAIKRYTDPIPTSVLQTVPKSGGELYANLESVTVSSTTSAASNHKQCVPQQTVGRKTAAPKLVHQTSGARNIGPSVASKDRKLSANVYENLNDAKLPR